MRTINPMRSSSSLALAGALSLALAGGGVANAQDSGLGIDLQFGNSLDPNGTAISQECDPRGWSWLSSERKRTPTGFSYRCMPDRDDPDVIDGEWRYLASIGLGYLYLSGDEGNASWQRYNGFDDGVLFSGRLFMVRPSDGSYVDLRGNRVDSDMQYYRLVAGRAGKYRVQAFARSQANMLSSNAQSLWSNLGEQHLTLVPELPRGATTPAQLQTFMANNPASRIGVTRDKQGLGLNYYLNARWTAFFNASHEQRQGSRPFGGPFSFGRLIETLRPIDDSTVNFNGGTRYIGQQWRTEFTYTGSFFRNGMDHFTYEMPFSTANNNPVGLFSYEPENDYHRLGATLTRKLASAWRGEFSLTAAIARSRQNDPLVPGLAACSGMLNATVSCDNWNMPNSLSQRTADMAINNQRLGAKLVLQPSSSLTWRSGFNFLREDYAGSYIAFNPLTGQYGYIGENGAFPNTVWLPGASNMVHVRNLPLDKETWELSTSLDWRLGRKNTLGFAYDFKRLERTHRELLSTDDNAAKLTWINRSIEWFTLRANYSYLNRNGGEYNPDPYQFLYTEELPGFVTPVNGLAPHTVNEMRKYDIGEREQNKFDVMGTFVLSTDMTLYVSARTERNDYKTQIGRRGYDTFASSVQWEWQPNAVTTLNAWYGQDRSKLDVANVNDIPAGRGDASLGGPSYPLDFRWWMNDDQRNRNAGAGLHRQFDRISLDLDWNYINAKGKTSWDAASVGASPTATAAGLTGAFPDMIWRINTLRASVKIPFTERISARAFATWEKGRVLDWHYQGFDVNRTVGNLIYTDGGPESYDAHLVGVLVEMKL